MAESIQHKLDRVRPPRVQITYDVETGGAIERKELPFVVGVLADLSGKPTQPLPKLKDRKFVEIDRDNFNDVMADIKPHLSYRVDNHIAEDGTKLGVDLTFTHIDDLEPARVAEKVDPLKKLLAIRRKLSELLVKMDGNDLLVDRLGQIIQDTEQLTAISKESGREPEKK